MKKKINLKVGGKVLLTIVIFVVSVFIYSKTGPLGELAQSHRVYQFICIGAWFWLLVGQMIGYGLVWSK